MNISRREFLQMLAIASAAGVQLPGMAKSSSNSKPANAMYNVPSFGNVHLMHFTDCHAQLLPIWFREPNINIGIGGMKGRPPHLVGTHLLKYFKIKTQ